MAKKKDTLDHLRTLTQRLTDAELRNLKQYLCCFDPNFDQGHKVKTLELLELIASPGKPQPEKEIIRTLYPEGNATAFKYLRLRLMDKIHESLLLDVNITPSQKYSDGARLKIELRKSLLLAEILWGRGLTETLPRLLDRVIRKASQMEHFGISAEALRLKQRFEGYREGLKMFWKVDQDILAAEDMERAIQRAKKLVTAAEIRKRETPNSPIWPEVIPQLAEIAQRFPCGFTQYYYMQGLKAEAMAMGDYPTASTHCRALAELLKTNPAVASGRRTGLVMAAQAELALLQQDFSRAGQLAIQARQNFPSDSLNHASTFELEFYANFFGGQVQAAYQLLNPPHRPAPQTENQGQRWLAMQASASFALGNFADTWRKLKAISHLMHQKSPWNLPMRLLEVMVQIELRQLDQVDLQLEAIRKHLRNPATPKSQAKRYSIILKLLKTLQKTGFTFSKMPKDTTDILAMLEPGGEVGWEILSGELVPFQQWFLKKYGKTKAAKKDPQSVA